MIYCFDLDGTLCTSVEDSDYTKAQPLVDAIQKVNEIYNSGNRVVIFTGRGSSSGKDWTEFTRNQINSWGILYHELITNRKPTYDIVIDDKAINAVDWRKINCGSRGVVAGAFDLIHPGYCRLFKFCKQHCDHLTVLLHDDPSIERNKLKPVHTIEERKEILYCIKYIDDVLVYNTENDLCNLLKKGKYDYRFLGSDYQNKTFTGFDIDTRVIYTQRDHDYSTTALKMKIKESLCMKQNYAK